MINWLGTITKATLKVVLVVVIGGFVVWQFSMLLSEAMERNDRATCLKLQTQAEQYPDFYLTQSEDRMCRAHGFAIDAPVR